MIATKLLARLKELTATKTYMREYKENTKYVHSRINKSIVCDGNYVSVYDLISGTRLVKLEIESIKNVYAADNIIRIPYKDKSGSDAVFSYYV